VKTVREKLENKGCRDPCRPRAKGGPLVVQRTNEYVLVVVVVVHCVPKKHPRHFQLYLENQLSNFNNFWHKYS